MAFTINDWDLRVRVDVLAFCQPCSGGHLATRQKTVAVVDDDAGMRRGIERLLNAHGLETKGFDSAEAFLDQLASSQADCLVLDIHLEGMSGIDLRRRLTASGSKLPVIFITAINDERQEQECINAGCVAYLRKPFPAELLLDAIKKALAAS